MESADAVARFVGRVGRAVQLTARRMLPVDTNPVDGSWRHVTKIDPEHDKPVSAAYPRYLQYTDGVAVGGSADVTAANTLETFALLEHASVPVFHEPSAAEHVTEATRRRAAFLAIPEVLNGDSDALVGTLGTGIEHIKEELVPSVLEDGLPSRVADVVPTWMRNVVPTWVKDRVQSLIEDRFPSRIDDMVPSRIKDRVPSLVDDMVPSWIEDNVPSWVEDPLSSGVWDGFSDRLVSVATSWLLADAVFEAYIIQNPESAAAREANVGPEDILTPVEAKRRALAAEYHLESEIVYVEYSGMYGGDDGKAVVAAVSDTVDWSRVWYGGGIESREHATAMLDAGADTVVVGNCFHDVAKEELDVYRAASDVLDVKAARRDIEHFVMDTVDVKDSAAVRYLSTIPGVDDPEWTASECLVSAIAFRFEIDRLIADAAHAGVSTREDLDGFLSIQAFDSAGERWIAESAVASVYGIPGEYAPIEHLRLVSGRTLV